MSETKSRKFLRPDEIEKDLMEQARKSRKSIRDHARNPENDLPVTTPPIYLDYENIQVELGGEPMEFKGYTLTTEASSSAFEVAKIVISTSKRRG